MCFYAKNAGRQLKSKARARASRSYLIINQALQFALQVQVGWGIGGNESIINQSPRNAAPLNQSINLRFTRQRGPGAVPSQRTHKQRQADGSAGGV